MNSDDKSGLISGVVFLGLILTIPVTIGLFWRGGDIRDQHVELERIRLEERKAQVQAGKPCRGWCESGRGFGIRIDGRCECVQMSDRYMGPE